MVIVQLLFKQVVLNMLVHLLIAGIEFYSEEFLVIETDSTSIILSGSQGVYAFQLRKSLTNRIPFQNRYRDIFLVEVDEQLQQIEYIVLEHNNENSAPAWFVDFVVIKLLNNQQEYLYDFLLSTIRSVVFSSQVFRFIDGFPWIISMEKQRFYFLQIFKRYHRMKVREFFSIISNAFLLHIDLLENRMNSKFTDT
jgi:hypothetical protein